MQIRGKTNERLRRAAAPGDTMKFTVTLPLPPSLNDSYATFNGRRLLSKAAREFKHEVAQLTVLAARQSPWRTRPSQRYRLELVLYFNGARNRDLSNTIKLAEDSIAEALGFNDSRIDELVVRRGEVDKENPRCEATVEVIG